MLPGVLSGWVGGWGRKVGILDGFVSCLHCLASILLCFIVSLSFFLYFSSFVNAVRHADAASIQVRLLQTSMKHFAIEYIFTVFRAVPILWRRAREAVVGRKDEESRMDEI